MWRCWGKCAMVFSILSLLSRASRSSELACFHRDAPKLFLALWCSTAAGPQKKALQCNNKDHHRAFVERKSDDGKCGGNLLKLEKADVVFLIFPEQHE